MQQSLLDMTAFNDITTTSAHHNCMIRWTITQTRIVHACWPASHCTVHLCLCCMHHVNFWQVLSTINIDVKGFFFVRPDHFILTLLSE